MPKVTVIEARVYNVYFDMGDFNPYAERNDMMPLPLFGCTVLANSVKDAIAKAETAFPNAVIINIHCKTESVIGHKVEAEKVVY